MPSATHSPYRFMIAAAPPNNAAAPIAPVFIGIAPPELELELPEPPPVAAAEAALDECLGTPVDAVMIGDTSFDIEMAKAAGVKPIGVAWGYHEPAELLRAGAAAVAEKPADLREMLLEG